MRELVRAISFGLGWLGRHRRYLWCWMIITFLTMVTGRAIYEMLILGLVAPTIASVWATLSPATYERIVASPARQREWRKWATNNWPALARQCGLARQVPTSQKVNGPRGWQRVEQMVWVPPRLISVTAGVSTLTLHIGSAPGQTAHDLEAGAERIAVMAGAHSHLTRLAGPGEVVLTLTMLDHLGWTIEARLPKSAADPSALRLGRTLVGGDWDFSLTGRHTLVVGCSGSGKGSVLWGVCAGLAPVVAEDRVRLWGIDLKRGIELSMGQGLFTAVAYTPDQALNILRKLLEVIDARGAAMRGVSRLHEAAPGDPTHVVVIDELAALTAYADAPTAREANRLLGEVLTQGRALGVVVVACIQDPRKEVIGLRGLFTQTVALRLRSAQEVSMVLGEGVSDKAPAHHINPASPGTAWVVEEDGTCTMVRADFWPDTAVQATSGRYSTPVRTELTDPTVAADDEAEQPVKTRERRSQTRRTRRPRTGPEEAA